MKYEKPQIVCLPDSVTSISANPLMKPIPVSDKRGWGAFRRTSAMQPGFFAGHGMQFDLPVRTVLGRDV
jgi:hypothetical protein